MQPGQPAPPIDPGNPFLSELPANLATVVVQTPAGPRLALTLRVGNGTLTAFLTRDDAMAWASAIEKAASGVSSLVVAGPGAIPGGMQ